MAIRGAMIADGNGTPASGPYDIIIENNRIVDVIALDPVALNRGAKRSPAPVEIDAAGKYVLPGLINAHAHIHDERDGKPQPLEYEFKIWLACGITSVRDVGSDLAKTLNLRARSAAGEIVAPRIFVYPMFGMAGGGRVADPKNADEARASVRQVKQMGVDGIKMRQVRRDVMEAIEDEAHKLNLPVAHHAGVEETTAWDDIRFGTRSIEHWYGIPDAAILDGVQNFPPSYNYNDESDRFRYAGRLWREADPKKLQEVLAAMVKANVAWVPTFDIYEASRDLQRAQNQPWFQNYLHPTLADYFRPDPGITAPTSCTGPRTMRFSGRRITGSGWRPSGISSDWVALSAPETTRASSIRFMALVSSARWNCMKKLASIPSKSSSTQPGTTRGS